MSTELLAPREQLCDRLPPRNVQIFDLKRDPLLETPLDERGLVDVAKLIEQIKTTVDPSYRWTSQVNDVHHLQWPASHYHNQDGVHSNPHVFRDLAISKVTVPRVFHNWLHRITIPPPLPSDEVMGYRTEAQNVAVSLFRTAKLGKQITRIKGLSDTIIEHRLIHQFEDFSQQYEEARIIPVEFNLIDTSERLATIHDMFAIGSKLGKIATVSTIVRRVTQSSAKAA